MTDSRPSCNGEFHVQSKLPKELTPGAVLIDDLAASGALQNIAEELRIPRKAGGYSGIDAVVFLLFYFASGIRFGGLRGFAEAFRPFALELGALAGRAQLMGQASLSRLLDAVTIDIARVFCQRLLRVHMGTLEVLRSPGVQTRDARGDAWHVFDFDPNREVYRRRNLARADECPEGARRTSEMAAPGYRGRQRGEVVMTQGLLMHAGTALCLHADAYVGNGDPRKLLQGALDAAAACCDAIDHPRNRALVRTDGEFGGVPSFTAAAASGMAYLSRLSRYELLDSADVRERLHRSRWEKVSDAGAGPKRIAADLGIIQLEAGETTFHADGTRFAPVEVRVIVSCYRCPKRDHEEGRRGYRIGDDAVFEMFGVIGLEPAAWSAGDIVSAYYGRCGQENRFAQADRELGINKPLSYNLGGHLLALACAFATWNWKIAQAVHQYPLPLPSSQELRTMASVEAPPELAAPDEVVQVPSPSSPPPEQTPDPRSVAFAALGMGLEDAAVASALAKRGLRWNAAEWVVENDAGQQYVLSSAAMDHTTPSLRFTLIEETKQRHPYVQISVPETVFQPIEAAVKELRKDNYRAPMRPTFKVARQERPPRSHRHRQSYQLSVEPAWEFMEAGSCLVTWPLFLPARARALTQSRLAERIVTVDVRYPLPEQKTRHPLMADNIDKVRRHRWSWSSRLAFKAAPSGVEISVH